MSFSVLFQLPLRLRSLSRLRSAASGAGATTAGSQYADVVATLANYFNGGHTGNADLIRSIWHPQVGALKGVADDGEGSLRCSAFGASLIGASLISSAAQAR